jgi:nitrate reductase gamma subunit
MPAKPLDIILFQLFPYFALALLLVVPAMRFRREKFGISSLSSQFLEGEQLFYGSVLWHYGILWVLGGHLVAFLFPSQILAFNSEPIRLYLLEITASIGGMMALIGLLSLAARRAFNPRIRAVTTGMDVAVLAVLIIQVALGVYIASRLRWGSNWYAISLVPYLRSLFSLRPDLAMLAPLPMVVKMHVFNAFVFFALLPFSRLIHVLAPPFHYLRRPYQLVVWNRDPRKRSLPSREPGDVEPALATLASANGRRRR